MNTGMEQFYEVFFEEAGELLEQMESLLVKADVNAPDVDDLNAIFRVAHSIKGGAGTFGFTDMIELTHVLESLLDKLRRGELALRADMIDVLLQAGDVLKRQLAGHRGSPQPDTAAAAEEICARVKQLGEAPAKPAVPAQSVAAAAECVREAEEPAQTCASFVIRFSGAGTTPRAD